MPKSVRVFRLVPSLGVSGAKNGHHGRRKREPGAWAMAYAVRTAYASLNLCQPSQAKSYHDQEVPVLDPPTHISETRTEKAAVNRPISIIVVDDHGLVRDSVSERLAREPDFEVVGVAEDGDDAITKVLELRPDVVLMDIEMPGISCFDAIQIIRSRASDTKFILVTAYEHDEHLERALRVKVNGFVTKHEGIALLAEAVRNVASGRIHFSPEVMSRLTVKGDAIQLENPLNSRLAMLSPRERAVLRVLARGVSLRDAAGILGISYKTADKQKASVMFKLGIHDRVELARYAIREGLVEP
jgi:DNA-binding NarL/FixJ family response regulator